MYPCFWQQVASVFLRLSLSPSRPMMQQLHPMMQQRLPLMKQLQPMMMMPLVGFPLLFDIVMLLLLMLLHYVSHVLSLLPLVLVDLRLPSSDRH
jgi:hypothetical protein